MLGEGTQEGKVECESRSPLQKGSHLRADTIKSLAPEGTQKGAGFKIFLSLLKIISVRAQDKTCEAQGCR